MMYRDTWKRSDEETKMAKVLEEIAMECGLGDAGNTSSEGGGMAVAIAYVMQKTTYVFPILGELLRLWPPVRVNTCPFCSDRGGQAAVRLPISGLTCALWRSG